MSVKEQLYYLIKHVNEKVVNEQIDVAIAHLGIDVSS